MTAKEAYLKEYSDLRQRARLNYPLDIPTWGATPAQITFSKSRSYGNWWGRNFGHSAPTQTLQQWKLELLRAQVKRHQQEQIERKRNLAADCAVWCYENGV